MTAMGKGRITAALVASLIVAGTGGALSAQADGSRLAREILALHNEARDEAGVPRLAWSQKLAGEAYAWARVLAREGRMRHAGQELTNDAGENLWMGSAGYYGPDTMVGAFVEEKRHYRHAAFPEVSKTGRWQDVGHYTQVVWRDTREVGCAIARGERDDFLVCRYFPAGNWVGQRAY
jgi:hypothetical protein